jgi:hypothetical protein
MAGPFHPDNCCKIAISLIDPGVGAVLNERNGLVTSIIKFTSA